MTDNVQTLTSGRTTYFRVLSLLCLMTLEQPHKRLPPPLGYAWNYTLSLRMSIAIAKFERVGLPRYRDARMRRATERPSSYCTVWVP
jgi:hypothetical protein